MFLKAFFIVLFNLIFVFSFPNQGMAAKICDMAEDTAGLQKCLRDRLNKAQQDLKDIFEQLEGEIELEKKDQLKELQQTWLDYRDQECMWEAAQASNDSLKIINELSCMSAVTENRANLLESAYAEYDASAPREFSNIPRWTNVLNKDFSQYVWDTEDPFLSDLNCDERDEIVVTGIKYETIDIKRDDAEIIDNSVLYQKNVAVAVIDNPDTGRPDVTDFVFTVASKGGENEVCDKKIKFEAVEDKASSKEETEEGAPSCLRKIKINQSLCADHFILNGDNGFVLEEKELEEEKSK